MNKNKCNNNQYNSDITTNSSLVIVEYNNRENVNHIVVSNKLDLLSCRDDVKLLQSTNESRVYVGDSYEYRLLIINNSNFDIPNFIIKSSLDNNLKVQYISVQGSKSIKYIKEWQLTEGVGIGRIKARSTENIVIKVKVISEPTCSFISNVISGYYNNEYDININYKISSNETIVNVLKNLLTIKSCGYKRIISERDFIRLKIKARNELIYEPIYAILFIKLDNRLGTLKVLRIDDKIISVENIENGVCLGILKPKELYSIEYIIELKDDTCENINIESYVSYYFNKRLAEGNTLIYGQSVAIEEEIIVSNKSIDW